VPVRAAARTLRGRLFLAVVLTFLPLLALEAYLLEDQATSLRARILSERQTLARTEAHVVDSFIQGNIRALEGLAQTSSIREAQPGRIDELLRRVIAQNPVWLTVAVSDKDGLNVSSITTPPGTVNVSDRDYFKGALAGTPTVGTAILTRSTGAKTVVLAVPLELVSGERAVLSAALALREVEQELVLPLRPGLEVLVVDRQRQLFIGPPASGDAFPVLAGDPQVEAALLGQEGAALSGSGGSAHVVAFAQAPLAGWAVLVREPAGSAFAEVDRQRGTALAVTGLATLAAVLIALLLGARLDRTYQQVEDARDALEGARERATAERDLLGKIVDEMPVAVAIYDAKGRALVRNRTYARVVGGRPPDDIGGTLRFYRVRTPAGVPIEERDHPTVRALRGETVRSAEVVLRHGDSGEDVHILVDGVPLHDAGRVNGALVVFQDITQIRTVERERAAFFDMASHEIKTPLTALLGHVQLARRRAQAAQWERMDEVLARAEQGGQRLAELVRDLLDVSRLDEMRLDLAHEVFDLGRLVGELVEEIQPTLQDHHIEPEREDGRFPVEGDPRRVTQILQNLLDNAVRYSPSGGAIQVSVRREDAAAVVRVTDRGLGIPEDERANLFQRFYRTSRTQSYGGTGLGLFISRRIAEAHGGTLWLERSDEGGSTFALALPLVTRKAPAERPEPSVRLEA